jgi:type II secretory pathway pseudopilin PulG
MRTFFARPRGPRSTDQTVSKPAAGRRRLVITRVSPRGQHGFLLIEVMMSALIVGLMVVATFTGFEGLTHKSAEQRAVDEAAVLAAQSQQQLRSDPASVLLAFKEGKNTYTATAAGTTFTIVQKASFGNGSAQTGCAATETTKGQGTYILISSTVSWHRMVVKPVEESSLITPPIGSALDVEASNGETPTSGVPVVIKYVPAGSTSTSSLEGTTGPNGCVLFAGIPSTEAKVEVRETSGIVNRHGTQSWPTEAVTLAPNVLTHHALKLAHAGSVTAEFTYENATKDTHKNNAGTGNVEETVTGDTFVVYNSEMEQPPNFEEGSTTNPEPFTGTLFEIIPGEPGAYKQTASSPTEPIKYPQGNLFPFPSPKNWTAWAGDCIENKPETFDAAVKAEAKTVPPGAPATIKVPTTYVMLYVYSKSQAEIKAMAKKGEATWPSLETAQAKLVTITDKKCSGISPDNETPVKDEHTQYTTTGGEWGGHLSAPFQPFGEYELCLAGENNRVYKPKEAYVNKKPGEPVTLNIYLNELSQSEKQAIRKEKENEVHNARLAKEAETKTAREASEAVTRTKREAGETETKTNRVASEAATKEKRLATEAATAKEREKQEATEKETKTKEEATKKERETKETSERNKWKEEETAKKITKKERETKEATQTTNRKAAEATEKTSREKRESEEKATANKKKEEEAAKKKAEEKELEEKAKAEAKEAETRKAAETKETETKNAAVAKEIETAKAELKKEEEATAEAVKKETTELAEKEDVVETKPGC